MLLSNAAPAMATFDEKFELISPKEGTSGVISISLIVTFHLCFSQNASFVLY
jgi:hypothetical protein